MTYTRNLVSATSPAYADAANKTVRLKATFVELPNFPDLDFLATSDDVEAHGRDIFARAIAGEFGTIAAYVPPAK